MYPAQNSPLLRSGIPLVADIDLPSIQLGYRLIAIASIPSPSTLPDRTILSNCRLVKREGSPS